MVSKADKKNLQQVKSSYNETNLAKSEEDSILDYSNELEKICGFVADLDDPFGICNVFKLGKSILGAVAQIHENQMQLRRMAHDISSLAPILLNISQNFELMTPDKRGAIQPALRTLNHDFKAMQEFTQKLLLEGKKKPSLLKKIITTAQQSLLVDKVKGEISEFRENMARSQQTLTLGLSSINTSEQAMRDGASRQAANEEEAEEEYEEEYEEVPSAWDSIMEHLESKNYDEAIKVSKECVSSTTTNNEEKSLASFGLGITYALQGQTQPMWQAIDDAGTRGFCEVEVAEEARKNYFTSLRSPADKAHYDKFVAQVKVNREQKYRYQDSLTEDRIAYYSMIFDSYDADHGGTIDQDEFRIMMAAANPSLTRKAIDGYLKRIDESGDNSIDIDEWLNLMADINANPGLYPGLDPELSFFKKSKGERAKQEEQVRIEVIPTGKGKGKKANQAVSSSSGEDAPASKPAAKKAAAKKAATKKAKAKAESESEESEDDKKKGKGKDKGKDDKKKDKGKEKDKGKGKEKEKDKGKGKEKEKEKDKKKKKK